MKSLSRLIARRYLFSTRQRFVPLLTFVALGGITLGVWSFTVVFGVMQGFQRELNTRWIGLNAHLTVSKLPLSGEAHAVLHKTISGWPEVERVQPFVEGEVILRHGKGDEAVAVAAKVRGVESLGPAFLALSKIYPADISKWGLLGGEEVLAALGVHPDYEDTVTVIYPFGEIGPTGDFVPNQKDFLVTHAFRTGFYEWDAFRILVPLKEAQWLLGGQGESGLLIRLKHIRDLEGVERRLRAAVPQGAAVASFAEQNRRLFAALKLERFAMGGFLVLFGLIATFSITGLLLLFVDAKRRDLAVLRAIGLAPRGSRDLFLTIGLYLGGIGALLGGGLGIATLLLLRRFPVPLPSTYYLDWLPVEINRAGCLAIMGVGLLLTLVSSLYPVRLAGRMDPLPMLREE